MTDSRIGTLAGILNTPPRPRPLPDTKQETPDDPPATARNTQRPKPKKSGPSENQPARVSATADVRARVVCRIPAELHQLLVARAAEQHLSQSALVLAAVENAHTAGVLPGLLLDEPKPSRGLFAGTQPRRSATAKVVLDLRMRSDDLAVLDGLATTHGATDRTHFITAALSHYLT